MISSEIFIPHTLQSLEKAKVFPSPLPEDFYSKMCNDYAQVKDIVTSRIVYESDGLKVTGISALPVKTEKGKHPIVIYNRGGNREFGRLTVLSVMRALHPFAHGGYLVYASNYRGNDGSEGIEEFGGADVGDVLNLIEIAKQNPAWDGKNIFMQGHSRGGMMTYACLRRNKTITAAVSIAGFSDMFQGIVERPEMETKVHRQLIKVPENEREEAYKARSAIFWADEIDAPLLLLHGDADDRVDVSHSINLAKKLEEAGKEYELVIYKGGSHALLRHWDEVKAKSIGWFEGHRLSTVSSANSFQGGKLPSSPSPFQGEGRGEGII